MGLRRVTIIVLALAMVVTQGGAGGVDLMVDTTFPEYILTDHINLTGTADNTTGSFLDDTDDHFSNGTLRNVSVANGSVVLEPSLDFQLLNNGNPVLSGGTGSAWDTVLLSTYVLEHNGIYYMYYVGCRSTSLTDPHHIGLATSTDGVNFTRFSGNPVLRSRVDSYDYTNLMQPVVFVESGTFHMFYGGNHGNSGSSSMQDIDICYASSSDGENWTKYSGNPVVQNGSPDSAWNGLGLRPADILRNGSTYMLYYKGVGYTGTGPVPRLGLHNSTDLTNWTGDTNNPLYTGSATGWEGSRTNYMTLESSNGTYRMWTFSQDSHEVGWIRSRNGVDWTDSGGPVLSPKAGTIYSDGLNWPRVLEEGGRYRMWVRCTSNNVHTIGLFQVTPRKLDGEFTSRTLDAGGEAKVTDLEWNTTSDAGSLVDLFLRWSNDSVNWTSWSRVDAGSERTGMIARYFQYRAEFRSTRDWMRSSLDSFRISYEVLVSSVEVQVDGGPWQTADGTPYDWCLNTSLHDGDYDILVRATDSRGDTASRTIPVKVDLFPPTGNITIEEGRYAHNSSNVLIDVEANDTHEPILMQVSRQPDFSGATWAPLVPHAVWQLIGSPEGEVTIFLRLRDDAGRISETYNDSIVIDTTPPEGRLLIDEGAKYTNSTVVTLRIEWTDLTGVVGMMVSNDPSFQGAIWQDPMEAFTWALEEGDGVKTVYVRIRDFVGWETTSVDDIILDGTPPAASLSIDQDAPFTTSRDVMLNITLYDVNPIRFKLANAGEPWPESWRTTESPVGIPWTLVQGEDGPRRVRMLVHDAADNEFTTYDDIVLDTTLPEGELVLNGGDGFTNVLIVDAVLSASDATSGVDRMRVSDSDDFSDALWQSVKNTFKWPISVGDGPKVIFVQLRDLAGLVTTIDATIYLDTTPPTGSLLIDDGAMFAISTEVELSIDVEDPTGLSMMRVTNGDTFEGTSWMSYSSFHTWVLEEEEGINAVLVEVRDNAGNSIILNDTIILDLTDPHGEVTINDGDEATLNLTVFIEWDAIDENGIDKVGFSEDLVFESDEIFWLHADDGIPIIQMPLEFTFTGTDGLKTAYMNAWDLAGRATLISDSIWYVGSRPEGRLTVGDGSGWSNSTDVIVSVEWTGGSEPTHYWVASESGMNTTGNWIPIGMATTMVFPHVEGIHLVFAELLGPHNVTSLRFGYHFTLDLTPPLVTIVTPGRDLTESETMLLNLTFQDNLDPSPVVRYSLNGGEWTVYDGTARLDLREGRNVILVEARDKAGNVAVASREVEYDVGFQVGGSLLFLLVLALVACLVVLWFLYNRRQRMRSE